MFGWYLLEENFCERIFSHLPRHIQKCRNRSASSNVNCPLDLAYLLWSPNFARHKNSRTLLLFKLESFEDSLLATQDMTAVNQFEERWGTAIVACVLEDAGNGVFGVFRMAQDSIIMSITFSEENFSKLQFIFKIHPGDLDRSDCDKSGGNTFR